MLLLSSAFLRRLLSVGGVALLLSAQVAIRPHRAEAVMVAKPQTAASAPLQTTARRQWVGPLWVPPVRAEVVDFFRPPLHPYGPGNRGLEFAVEDQASVSSVGDGVVSFAGRIGPSWHVVVDHADGLRSGYSHLSEVDVKGGDVVAAGQLIGRSSQTFHLSARLSPGTGYANLSVWGPRRYVDPLILFGLDLTVRFVPSTVSTSQHRRVSGR